MLWRFGRIAVLVLVAAIACALLVARAPGAGVDERVLDRRLREETIRDLRSDKGILGRYLSGLSKGDMGYSESNHAPIAYLIADRTPTTLRELAFGLFGGWFVGLALAIPRTRIFSPVMGLLLSLPTALIAYLCLLKGAKSTLVLAIVLAPRVFRFSRNLVAQAYTALHVEMARARGVSEAKILLNHVLPSISPQLLALGAASVSMTIGAMIPVEAICDVPGIGKLAWNAAMARDLPLLVTVTAMVAIATGLTTAISES